MTRSCPSLSAANKPVRKLSIRARTIDRTIFVPAYLFSFFHLSFIYRCGSQKMPADYFSSYKILLTSP